MNEAYAELDGVDAFIDGVTRYAAMAYAGQLTVHGFINAVADDYAFIRVRDITRPIRFLRQMEGVPPLALGTDGFNPDLVDDANPARHYTAFVFVGYWLPRPLALLTLWLWEMAGFVRYGGVWSAKDMASGRTGIRHGAWVRQAGPVVLPGLIAAELATAPDEVPIEAPDEVSALS